MNPIEMYNKIKKETEKPCVFIKLTDSKQSIFESKAGGVGYIPHDGNFPTDSKGNQLRLLAQIDCSKVQLDEYPKQGLLQFWILNNDLSGADFDNNTNQDGFRVIYHKTIDETVTEDEIKAKIVPNENERDGGEDFMPVYGEYGMEFNLGTNAMTEYDYRFQDYDFDADEPEEIPVYNEELEKAFGHKIGGYPGFTQWDPREEQNDTHDFQLLQLDSEFADGKDKILWGDAGIANFFINTEKLKNLDFSDVIYNWDCY